MSLDNDNDKAFRLITLTSFLDSLGVSQENYPDYPALTHSFNTVVKSINGVKSAPASLKQATLSDIRDMFAGRQENIRDFWPQFAHIYKQDDYECRYISLQLAAFCDETVLDIKIPTDQREPIQTSLMGMDIEHISDAQDFYHEACALLMPNSSEEPEIHIYETENGEEIIAVNDNEAHNAFTESFFLAHMMGIEKINRFKHEMAYLSLSEIRNFRLYDLDAMASFADVKTDIGSVLWEQICDIEKVIEEKLNPPPTLQPG
jgi:hypothetical protein